MPRRTLGECRWALWGGARHTEEWARTRVADLEQDRFAELPAIRSGVRGVQSRVGYFEANRERMRYDEFRGQSVYAGS